MWPSHGWPNGLFDITMTEKPRAAYHRSQWNKTPLVKIQVPYQQADIDHGRDLWQWPTLVDHWNLSDHLRELVIPVWTVTNCEEVELYQDGKLMGRQKTADFPNNTIVWNIPYRPGKLAVKGYNAGAEVAADSIATTKGTSSFRLRPDVTAIKADGQDLSHIFIELFDEDGRLVQTDDRMVTVTVEGEGKLRTLDTAELRRTDPFGPTPTKSYYGRALAVVQSTRTPGKAVVKVTVEGIDEPAYLEINTK